MKNGALPPPAEPATAANPLDLIAGRTTELSAMVNQLSTASSDLAAQTQSLTEAVLAEQSLPEYFLNEAERLALQRPKYGANLRANFPEIGKTAVSEPTCATIEAFIALYGEAQQRAILTSILNVMSDEDVQVTAAALATEQARARFSSAFSNYMNLAVICNDNWGGLQVASNIRTLVVNGSLDALTPKEWGDLVCNSLTNAISTTIPYGGHGASAQTACGQGCF